MIEFHCSHWNFNALLIRIWSRTRFYFWRNSPIRCWFFSLFWHNMNCVRMPDRSYRSFYHWKQRLLSLYSLPTPNLSLSLYLLLSHFDSRLFLYVCLYLHRFWRISCLFSMIIFFCRVACNSFFINISCEIACFLFVWFSNGVNNLLLNMG